MTDYAPDRRLIRKQQSYALRMLNYEIKVGFLRNSDIDLEPDKPPIQVTNFVVDECVSEADHLSFESQVTTEEQIFFDGVKALCVHHFGEISGAERFEILCEAYVSSIDNASRVSNLKARKIEAKRDLIKQLDDLVQSAKLATQRVKADDVRTLVKFLTTAFAFGAAIWSWFQKK